MSNARVLTRTTLLIRRCQQLREKHARLQAQLDERNRLNTSDQGQAIAADPNKLVPFAAILERVKADSTPLQEWLDRLLSPVEEAENAGEEHLALDEKYRAELTDLEKAIHHALTDLQQDADALRESSRLERHQHAANAVARRESMRPFQEPCQPLPMTPGPTRDRGGTLRTDEHPAHANHDHID